MPRRSRSASSCASPRSSSGSLNPFAAALLIPALNLWLWLAQEEVRARRWLVAALVLEALLPALAVLGYYAHSFGLMSPGQFAWSATLLVAGGGIPAAAAIYWSVVLGCLTSAVILGVRASRSAADARPGRAGRDRPRAGRLRRPGLARRDQVGAAAMTLRRLVRDVSSVLIIAGLLLVLDAGLTLVWQEPVTAVIGLIQRDEIDKRYLSYRTVPLTAADRTAFSASRRSPQRIAFLARREAASGTDRGGDRAARDQPRSGSATTSSRAPTPPASSSGPGHYPSTAFPGLGQTVAIAGHRTTYLAPFRNLNELARGDRIVLQMPYASSPTWSSTQQDRDARTRGGSPTTSATTGSCYRPATRCTAPPADRGVRAARRRRTRTGRRAGPAPERVRRP